MNAAQTDALLRLKNDPKYFIERFFYIVDKKRLKVPFIFNEPQTRYYEARTHNDLILKARKEGFSTLIEALFLHAAMFGDNQRCVTMSHELESTMRHLERVSYMLENLGLGDYAKFTVELEDQNQKQIRFARTNSSYWIGTAGAKAFGRGDDITHLHLSEVAHYENHEVLTGVLEACVPGAFKVMETTAKGLDKTFYKAWKESEDQQSDSPWTGHFFAWYDDPTNEIDPPTGFKIADLERRVVEKHGLLAKFSAAVVNRKMYWWRLKRAEMLDRSKMPQEYPGNPMEAFISGARHVFDLEKIQAKIMRARYNPPMRTGELDDDGAAVKVRDDGEGRLRIWKMPRMDRQYLISADVALGVPDGNWSVAHVLDRASWEQVAVWRGRLDPGDFGREMVKMGVLWNNAVLVPEFNNDGRATVEAIKGQDYPHLFRTTDIWKDTKTIVFGFPTTDQTRTPIITAIRNANDQETVFINDLVTLGEMETFIENEKSHKMEAQEGSWDDCVISLAIGVYCLGFMTVDETYAPHAKRGHGSPLLVQNIVESRDPRREAGGYRRRTGQ